MRGMVIKRFGLLSLRAASASGCFSINLYRSSENGYLLGG